jgi:ribosomal protein L11 methyltransferase
MYMNPFDTKSCNFKLSFQTKYKNLKYFEDFLDFAANSVSVYEVESSTIEAMPEDLWMIDAFFEDNPESLFKAKIMQIASENDIKIEEIIVAKAEDKDWVIEVQKNFRPFIVERFFVASKFYEEDSKTQPLESIIINPSRAFGTGEHQTTKACIKALEVLASERTFKHIADIGTGTGILAIAAKKIWQSSRIIGSDIEEISCEIAKDNCEYNGCPDIKIICSDGFKSFGEQKFDLIISNILLGPLIDNASDMMKYLSPNGRLVLSGFLKNQEQKLVDVFSGIGFNMKNQIYIDDWVALIF